MYGLQLLLKFGKTVILLMGRKLERSRHQNAGQNHNMKITNGSFGNMAKFKYLGKINESKYYPLGNQDQIKLG
jgi:hypothetical protein